MTYQGDQVDVSGRLKLYRDADFPVGGRVLNVGCAEGADEIFLAGRHPGTSFVGIDLDRTAIEKANDAAWRAGVRNVLFLCMDARQFLIERSRGPTDLGRMDVLMALSVTRWIGPTYLVGLVRIFEPRVIYFESHSDVDKWSEEFQSNDYIQRSYGLEGLGRLPYTNDDPRLLRVLFRMERV